MNKLVVDNPQYEFVREIIGSLPWSPTHSHFVFESSSPIIIPEGDIQALEDKSRDLILKKFVVKKFPTPQEIELERHLREVRDTISRKFVVDSRGDYTRPNSPLRKELLSVVTNELNIEITDPAQFERMMRVRLNLEANCLDRLKKENYQLHRPGEANELDQLISAGYVLLEPKSKGSLFDDFTTRGYLLRSGLIGSGYGGNSEGSSINFRALGNGNKPKHLTLSFASSGDKESYGMTREWLSLKAADYKLAIQERDDSKRSNSA